MLKHFSGQASLWSALHDFSKPTPCDCDRLTWPAGDATIFGQGSLLIVHFGNTPRAMRSNGRQDSGGEVAWCSPAPAFPLVCCVMRSKSPLGAVRGTVGCRIMSPPPSPACCDSVSMTSGLYWLTLYSWARHLCPHLFILPCLPSTEVSCQQQMSQCRWRCSEKNEVLNNF